LITTALQLQEVAAEWHNTADGDYFRFVRNMVDEYLNAAKNPARDERTDGPLEDGAFGSQLLLLYRVTLDPKYYEAAKLLRQSLALPCGLSATAGPKCQIRRQARAMPRAWQRRSWPNMHRCFTSRRISRESPAI
jgi:hypothetical protein